MDKVKREQFIAAAIQELKPRGFNVLGPLVQADVESGRFKSIVGWNNFWGIKASKRWEGKTVCCPTTELAYNLEGAARITEEYKDSITRSYYDSKKKRIVYKVLADFRDWHRETEAMKWYSGLLGRGYPVCWDHRGDKSPLKFFRGFEQGKWGRWCTEKEYYNILVDRYERYYKGGIYE